VITCNRCGSTNPAGVLNCQMCGTPLMSKIENELSPRTAQQGQPPLPAWLETLRVGDRPAAPGNAPIGPGFSAADLLDEGTLPSWMRSGRSEQQGQTPPMSPEAFSSSPFSQQNPPQSNLRPSSQMGPNTGDEGFMPRGIAANSLIDEQALPSWMQQDNKSAEQGPQSSISGASLLQSDALPEWMRSIGPSSSSPTSQGRPDPQSFSSQSPFMAPSSFAPPEKPQAAPAAKPQVSPSAPAAKPQNPLAAPLQQGFSAGDLVDPQSLPSWMSQSNNAGNAPGTPGQPAQPGFAASSLLDSDALPPWLRQGGQNQPRSTANSALNDISRAEPAQSSWPPAPPPKQMSQASMSGISASSFIDKASLPGWLRSDGDMGQQSGPAGSARPAVPGAGRVENMRVPNRPRNEMNSTDNSEIAANVFASMLGVASATPQYPGQSANGPFPTQNGPYPGAQGPQNAAPQKPQSMQSPAAPGMNSGIYGQPSSIPAGTPASAYSAQSNSYPTSTGTPPPAYGAQNAYQGGMYQGGMSGMNTPGSSQGPGSFGNASTMNSMGSGSSPYPGNGPGAGSLYSSAYEEQKSAKPAKRSFFETLRDLFFSSKEK
jgi:hypothetical protein